MYRKYNCCCQYVQSTKLYISVLLHSVSLIICTSYENSKLTNRVIYLFLYNLFTYIIFMYISPCQRFLYLSFPMYVPSVSTQNAKSKSTKAPKVYLQVC